MAMVGSKALSVCAIPYAGYLILSYGEDEVSIRVVSSDINSALVRYKGRIYLTWVRALSYTTMLAYSRQCILQKHVRDPITVSAS